ncbi:MAG: hypothetical protein GEV08_24615, partial [Acidimicrobiia bacterium]|nr:hypothetical protein [Acidimicrobiia bacterium]
MTTVPDEDRQALRRLAHWLTAGTGVRFDGHQRARLLDTIRRCARSAGWESYDDYRVAVERDRHAFDDLVDALAVGETYFFRDSRQTDLIQRHLLPASAAERHGAPVEVWTA